MDLLNSFPVLMLSQRMLDTPGMLRQSTVWGPHRGSSRRETLGRAGMEMECTSHALAKSTGTRDKEREQAEDTGVGVSFREGWVMVLAPGLPHCHPWCCLSPTASFHHRPQGTTSGYQWFLPGSLIMEPVSSFPASSSLLQWRKVWAWRPLPTICPPLQI